MRSLRLSDAQRTLAGMRLRARFLSWLWRRLDRYGYACLGVSRRVQARALNAIAEQPSLPGDTDYRGHGYTGMLRKADPSGSPAEGESGGRRCDSHAAAFQMFMESRIEMLEAARRYVLKRRIVHST